MYEAVTISAMPGLKTAGQANAKGYLNFQVAFCIGQGALLIQAMPAPFLPLLRREDLQQSVLGAQVFHFALHLRGVFFVHIMPCHVFIKHRAGEHQVGSLRGVLAQVARLSHEVVHPLAVFGAHLAQLFLLAAAERELAHIAGGAIGQGKAAGGEQEGGKYNPAKGLAAGEGSHGINSLDSVSNQVNLLPPVYE